MSTKISGKEIDEKVDNFYCKEGRYPNSNEFSIKNGLPSRKPIIRLYGSISKYYEIRGIDKKRSSHNKIEDTDAIDMLKNFDCIGTPTAKMVDDNKSIPSTKTYVNKFGTFNNALKLAGYGINKVAEYTKEEVISIVKTYDFGEDNITYEYMRDNNLPSQKVIDKYFGKLKNLCEELGLTYNNGDTGYTDIELLNILKQYDFKNLPISGMLISSIEQLPTRGTYNRHFGSIENACKLAGIPYNPNDGTSIWEKEVVFFVKSITNENIEENDRTALENGKEIDIYIPDLDIGIECNGDYWHSKEYKDKNYHINKTNRAKEFGITLIHIFESEWENNREEIEQYLRSIINKTTAQIYRGKNKLEIDNMKPMKYINIQVVEVKEPQLKTFGKHQCWDCGTTIYEVIK